MALSETLERKIAQAEEEYARLARELAQPSLAKNGEEMRRLARAIGELEPFVETARALKAARNEREKLEQAIADEGQEFAELAGKEMAELHSREREMEGKLRSLADSRGKGEAKKRGVILEIRAGTGGEEAALFSAQLLRMYLRYADTRGWKTEIAEMHKTELGGIREASVSIEGEGAWSMLRNEGGVHRVQRVPVTEASGRLHTSAVAVVVLPQAEEIDVKINPDDLRIDTFCSSGPGGQSVNTSYSAVRIVHQPTGIVVQCQDERSQIKNKARAMKVLRARLLAAQEDAQQEQMGRARREQVRKADRSEKIRTYNFPQNRVSDHRIGLTLHRLQTILDGDLTELLESLASAGEEGKIGK